MGNADADIAYQNKDIFSKFMGERMRNKSFEAYGLDLPEIVRVEPTNLPTIKAMELRIDNLFELADGTFAIVDYESDYDEKDKLKYAGYLTGVLTRYYEQHGKFPVLRMVVIYTADVVRGMTKDQLDAGALKIQMDTAFLSDLSGDEIYRRLSSKLQQGQPLDDTDCMQFMIAPLTYRTKEAKQEAVRKAYELSNLITDEETLNFILPGLVVFCEKIIDEQTYIKMRERIRMTRMGREFEEEKRKAVERALMEGESRGEAKGKTRGMADAVRALMASMKVTAKEAMDMLAVPDGMRSAVRAML